MRADNQPLSSPVLQLSPTNLINTNYKHAHRSTHWSGSIPAMAQRFQIIKFSESAIIKTVNTQPFCVSSACPSLIIDDIIFRGSAL